MPQGYRSKHNYMRCCLGNSKKSITQFVGRASEKSAAERLFWYVA